MTVTALRTRRGYDPGPDAGAQQLIHAESILPSQWHGRTWDCGERRLMAAVLEDACFIVMRAGHYHPQDVLDAWAWLDSREDAPFSFEAICAVLTLDTTYLRRGLERFRGLALKEAPRRIRRQAVAHRRDARSHLAAVR